MRAAEVVLTLVLSVAAGTGVYAQGNPGNGRGGRGSSGGGDAAIEVDIDIRLGSDEVTLIRAWFGDSSNLAGLPPGLARRESLPPGLQRQLQRNGTLPPGLQARVHPLPADLESRLPSKRAGTHRVVLGGNLILIEKVTSIILDIVSLL
jgi:hypothetical protein